MEKILDDLRSNNKGVGVTGLFMASANHYIHVLEVSTRIGKHLNVHWNNCFSSQAPETIIFKHFKRMYNDYTDTFGRAVPLPVYHHAQQVTS